MAESISVLEHSTADYREDKPEVFLYLEATRPETEAVIEKYQKEIVEKIAAKYPHLENLEEISEVVLIFINEMYNNAIFHGGFGEDGTKEEEVKNAKNKYKNNPEYYESLLVEISLVLEKDGFKLLLRDHGKGFDVDNMADPLAPENLMNDKGRGVFILYSMAAREGFEKIQTRNLANRETKDHGILVTLEKRF